MAGQSAVVVDFQSYREARDRANKPAAAQDFSALPTMGQPMIMWVPVWTFYPVITGMWING